MFRAQSNIFDDVVVKATDENLTNENWEYILVRSAFARCWAATWAHVATIARSTIMRLSTPTHANVANSLRRMYATKSDRPTRAPKMPSPP